MAVSATVKEWMSAIKHHNCDQAKAVKDRRKYNPNDNPENLEDDKPVPLIGYGCRGCGEIFHIKAETIFKAPNYDKDLKPIFSSMKGRIRLAAVLSGPPPSSMTPEDIEEASINIVAALSTPDDQGKPEMPKEPASPKVPEKPDPLQFPAPKVTIRRLLIWEKIEENGFEWRAPVPGGWLVKTMDIVVHFDNGTRRDGQDWRPAIAFIPDPQHTWGKE
jgi:hypothetical protein